MTRRIGIAILSAIGGFTVAALAGYFLTSTFSANTHDRSLEAAMTSIFLWGPLGALVAFIAGMILSRRKPDPPFGS